METIQHGDVILYPIKKEEYEKLISGAKEEKTKGIFTLAYGEVTGHSHKLTVERPETLTVHKLPDGRGVIKLGSDAKLSHEEHGVLTVPGTYYIQGFEREVDWFSKTTRRVLD